MGSEGFEAGGEINGLYYLLTRQEASECRDIEKSKTFRFIYSSKSPFGRPRTTGKKFNCKSLYSLLLIPWT